jgi:periplasmic protein TonB
MTARAQQAGRARLGLLRWAFCLAVVAAAHGAVAMVLLRGSPEADHDFTPGAPIPFDLLPMTPAATPSPPRDLAPGPAEAPSEQTPPRKDETKPREKESEVALPEPEPPKPEPPMEERQATAPPSVAMAVPNEAPPTAGVETPRPRDPSAAVLLWQSKLSAQIARFKRYPAKAQARREEGTVRMTFTTDRNGRVLESHIIESSGSADLDNEFLSMLVRAQPLPKPPVDAQDVDMSFVMAMRFSLK